MIMKKTQIKDAARLIKKQFVSWLSILMIAMLAVLTFVGINNAGKGLSDSGLKFYGNTNFRDVEMISTMLFTARDIEDIEALDTVLEAEGKLSTSAKLSSSKGPFIVDVSSVTERINVPIVIEGRLPENEDECVVEKGAALSAALKTGDSITLKGDSGETPDYLKRNSFRITGIVLAPEQAADSTATAGNLIILVNEKAFDMGEYEGCYFRTLVRFNAAESLNRFTPQYDEAVKNGISSLSALAKDNTLRRTEEMKEKARQQLLEKQKELEDGIEQLEKAKTELDVGEFKLEQGAIQAEEGRAILSDAAAQLSVGRKQADEGRAELEKNEVLLDDAAEQLYAGKRELDKAKETLDNARLELIDGWSQLEDGKEQARQKIKEVLYSAVEGNSAAEAVARLISFSKPSYNIDPDDQSVTASALKITEGIVIDLYEVDKLFSDSKQLKDTVVSIIDSSSDISPEEKEELRAIIQQSDITLPFTDDVKMLLDGVKQWDDGHAKYLDGLSKYNDGLAEYQRRYAEYRRGRDQFDEGYSKYENGLLLLDEKQKEYDDGVAQLDSSQSELEKGKQQLSDGKIQYEENRKKLEEAVSELEKAKLQIENLAPCSWIYLDQTFNFSFNNVKNAAINVKSLGIAFASVFIIVAALVIYTTVGKLVEDQRRLLGASKALGFFGHEIFFKYLTFGLSASITGMVLGLIIGHTVIQAFVLKGYSALLVYKEEPGTLPLLMILTFIGGIALTFFSVYAACRELLKAPARELMQDKMPAVSNRKKKGKSRLSLLSRLILRNIRTDKKRIIVTIASIAGCTVMIVTGFTLRASIIGSIDNQFNNILHYEMQVNLAKNAEKEDFDEAASLIENAGASSIPITSELVICRARDDLYGYRLICSDLRPLQEYYSMKDHRTKKTVDIDSDGIWINYTASVQLGLSTGDLILVYDSEMQPHTAKVAGIFDINLGQHLIISPESYKELFGKDSSQNAFLVKTNGADPEKLESDLNRIEKIMGVTSTKTQRESIESITSITNSIAVIMVFIAGLMSYFILLNLVNMNISQKKRELTVMRINGFSIREVKAYIQKESIASTVIGIAIGLLLGQLLSVRVITLVEGVNIFFMKNIQWGAWLISATITAAFAVVINMIALRKVKHLKLSDMTE